MKTTAFLVLRSSAALAQTAPDETASSKTVDVADLSLESLLDSPVEVTRDARSTRESASVLLVVTREEVLASGARDLQSQPCCSPAPGRKRKSACPSRWASW